MENVILTVHLILALLLIGVVLLQRSEGGGLGMGGGGGGGVMTGRQAANALSKFTWLLAVGFLITSITLTVIAARNATGGSVLDQLDIGTGTAEEESGDTGSTGLENYAPPPASANPQRHPRQQAPQPLPRQRRKARPARHRQRPPRLRPQTDHNNTLGEMFFPPRQLAARIAATGDFGYIFNPVNGALMRPH